MSRYDNRVIFINNSNSYKEKLSNRNLISIQQYKTGNLKHPTVEEMKTLDYIEHVWKTGDRYWKLAELHYGDGQLWWVLAWFNRMPMESDIELGVIIQIPTPLETLLSYMGL